jgi:hypothetical protein
MLLLVLVIAAATENSKNNNNKTSKSVNNEISQLHRKYDIKKPIRLITIDTLTEKTYLGIVSLTSEKLSNTKLITLKVNVIIC